MKIVTIMMLGLALMACDKGMDPLSAYNGTQLPQATGETQGMEPVAYRAVDQLLNAGIGELDRKAPILVTSLVNVDDLKSSSTFGRLLGDQASNRLVQRGYVVKELRLGNSLVVREGTGELILSRDAQKISRQVSAQAILAGTYAVGQNFVYVNMRLISAESDRIVSAVDLVTPLDGDARRLLADKGSFVSYSSMIK